MYRIVDVCVVMRVCVMSDVIHVYPALAAIICISTVDNVPRIVIFDLNATNEHV